jgi:pimeloyl-ACP methyl ester carboxylesterase
MTVEHSEIQATDIEITTPGLTLAARAWGPRDGIPVLAFHGWLDNAATWDRVAPHLEDIRLVSVDFPGHGQSEHRPRGATYHFVDLVPTIFDVADALGLDTFSILAHSMGAAASTLAAGTCPERIERLALVDGLGPWTTPPKDTPEQLEKGIRERRVIAEKTKRVFASREDVAQTIAKLYGITQEQTRPLLDRGVEQVEGGFSFTYDLALRATSMLRFTEEQIEAFFKRVECPILLIRPENGWPVDPDDMKRRIGWLDDLRVEEVAGSHHVHLEHPTLVAELVQPFLQSEN